MSRETSFDSHGARCDATWFDARPDLSSGSDDLAGPAGRPCVVMAHGFGCTRQGGLAPYAEAFADLGCHVLLFDYRGFGTSETRRGGVRQAVSFRRQREDYRAAIAAARATDGVDPDRVVVWGTSYSGGHVVAVAARDHRLAAVVAQGAAVDGLAVLRKPERSDPTDDGSKGRRMLAAALRDLGRAALRRDPVLVDAVGPPGSFALLTAESWTDFLDLMGPGWDRRVCARSVLGLPFNRAVLRAGDVSCPTLLVVAEQDTITPTGAVRETARRIGDHAEVVAFDCPHFDLYTGERVLADSLAAQTTFLRRVLVSPA